MSLFPSRIRDLSFWHYQIGGMIVYSIFRCALIFGWREFHWQAAASVFCQFIVLFFLFVGLRFMYRRLPFQSMSLMPLITRIGIISFCLSVLWFGIWAGIEYSFFGQKAAKALGSPLFIVTRLSYSFPIFLGWSSLYFGIKTWRCWLLEQDHTREATEAAQRAQLQMLRYQLNPHFLFNALNSVRALVDEDTRSARTMITELSEFLRYSLTSRNKPTVTLKEELDAVRLYLSIEQQRYEDKLFVEYDIARDTEDISVPSILIHPIVEYALRCSMQTSRMPLQLTIRSRKRENRLCITVLHSGSAIPGSGNHEPEIEQVEARLKELFPEQYRLAISSEGNMASTLLELTLPHGASHEE